MTAKSNRSLSANIFIIWETTAMGDKNYRKMSSIQLDSHANMVVAGKQACIIQRSWKSDDVRKSLNECSNMEKVPIVDAALSYD